ncbi:MAG TPA: DNA repair protein RecO [Thioalkalivibrio sp.]|nr:DNA repair protein RecO [Thioalkalivibrio sp.]
MRATDEASIGYILHRRPYRENSLILDVLTREHGRVSLVARKRGGRKAASPIAYEAFRRLRLSWRGRGELKTLTGFEQAGTLALGRDRLLFGLYVNELLMRLLPRSEAEPGVFEAYERALMQWSAGAPAWEVTTRFEIALLQALGYGLEPDAALQHETPDSPARRVRIPSLSAATRAAVAADTLGDARVLAELRALLDALFYHYLAGRRLRTRALLPSSFTR